MVVQRGCCGLAQAPAPLSLLQPAHLCLFPPAQTRTPISALRACFPSDRGCTTELRKCGWACALATLWEKCSHLCGSCPTGWPLLEPTHFSSGCSCNRIFHSDHSSPLLSPFSVPPTRSAPHGANTLLLRCMLKPFLTPAAQVKF